MHRSFEGVLRLVLLFAAAGSCGKGGRADGDTAGDADADTDGDTDPEPDGSAFHTAEHGCTDLYDQDIFPTFEIDVDEEEWAALQAGLTEVEIEYHPLRELRYEDEVVLDAEMRIRGNTVVPEKLQLQISFNENDREARFHGLRKLAFDAPPYDPSLLRNRLASSILLDLGIPVSCTNNARVVVNGEFYGLYANVERVDRELLERTFGYDLADGNLYKDGRELSTNEDHGDTSRMLAFWEAVGDLSTLETFGDPGQWLTLWSTDSLLPHSDGYCCAHNFYLYDHPTQGFVFIGWDYDLSFDAWVGGSPSARPTEDPRWGNYEPPVETVLDDAGWFDRWMDALADGIRAYDPAVLHARIDAWAAQIADAVAEDDQILAEDHAAAVASLRRYVTERSAWLETWRSCMDSAPGEDDPDGDGFNWCQWCADRQPASVEVCDGRDDDCDGVVDDDCTECTELSAGGRRVLFCAEERTWQDAEAACEALGTTLAVPTNDAEQTGFFEIGRAFAPFGMWIGANDLAANGAYTDADGMPLAYTSFGEGEPSEDQYDECVAVGPWAPSSWDVQPCVVPHPTVCVAP